MKAVSRHIIRHAHQLAWEIGAQALLVYADAFERDEELLRLLRAVNFRIILIARPGADAPPCLGEDCLWVVVPDVHMTRAGLVKMALLNCLAKGALQPGDRVVCLSGIDGSGVLDALIVLDLGTEPELLSTSDTVSLSEHVNFEVFERALTIATALAVEGREGRPVGLIFVLGDSDNVLAQSRNLVLNPFHGYPESERNLLDAALEETIKEYSALDGAFVIRSDGVVLTAGAHLIPTRQSPPLPKGLGTRHAAAAAITASTRSLAIAVSQSTGSLTVFKSGQMVTDIHKPINGVRHAI